MQAITAGRRALRVSLWTRPAAGREPGQSVSHLCGFGAGWSFMKIGFVLRVRTLGLAFTLQRLPRDIMHYGIALVRKLVDFAGSRECAIVIACLDLRNAHQGQGGGV